MNSAKYAVPRAAVEMLVSYRTLARYPGVGVFHSYEGICKHVNRHETGPFDPPV